MASLRFDRIGREEGLSQSVVNDIIRDRQGFIWIATSSGLNRFDGYRMKVYRSDQDDPYSLSDGDINHIFEDSKGRIWLGSNSGTLEYLDAQHWRIHKPLEFNGSPYFKGRVLSMSQAKATFLIGTTEGFYLWQEPQGKPLKIPFPNDEDHEVYSLLPQQETSLWWLGTNKGLFVCDLGTQKIERANITFENPDLMIQSLYLQREALWIGTKEGLFRKNIRDQNDAQRQTDKELEMTAGRGDIIDLAPGREGVIWAATQDGLCRIDNTHETPRYTFYNHIESDPYSLSLNSLTSVYEDSDGVLWIGTWGGGLNHLDRDRESFEHFDTSPNQLAHKMVNAIVVDKDQNLWVGTDKGLNIRGYRAEAFKTLELLPNHDEAVYSLAQGNDNDLWIGTFEGLIHLEIPTREMTLITSKTHGLPSNRIWSLAVSETGQVWIGTSNEGISILDPHHKRLKTTYKAGSKDSMLQNNGITHMLQDHLGTMWVATLGGGLSRHLGESQFETFRHGNGGLKALSDDRVLYLFQARDKTLYMGTQGGGLNRYNPETNDFLHWRRRHGLPSDTVYAIQQDDKGFLWLATDDGLARFNPANQSTRVYLDKDGLQSNEFNSGACASDANGQLYFGGIGGLNIFSPKNLRSDSVPPKMHITELLLYNEVVQPMGKDGLLKKPISFTEELVLDGQHKVFALEFTGLHYGDPSRHRYAYYVEGSFDNWVYTDMGNRRATFTELQSGTYTLRIKGTNKHGVWSEEDALLNIRVLPPAYKSWWAYCIYIFLSITILVFLLQGQNRKLSYERGLVERLREVDRLKDDFLANTSHELRTPLNGIIGLAESMLDGAAGAVNLRQAAQLTMVASSGRRLASLVDDILDFSKLKHHGLTLNLRQVDVSAVTDVVFTLCGPLAADKGLQLHNDIPSGMPRVKADENRLQQILYNLVGNAIKYTPNGSIRVFCKIEEPMLKIGVEDTGIGIPEDKQENIFRSFEKIEGSMEQTHGGTGLGLALSRRLVMLHGGEISVSSQPGEGATFAFTLPIGKESEQNEEDAEVPVFRFGSQSLRNEPTGMLSVSIPNNNPNARFHILIADDEPVNRQVLLNHLSMLRLKLTSVRSGPEALETIKEDPSISLVLLDVMMPGMSGYDVCRKLRETHPVEELPVIFLSARTRAADIVAAFDAGANDYLIKPVAKQELIERVRVHLRLLDARRSLVKTHENLTNTHIELQKKNEQLITAHQKLVIQEKMATVGTLASGIVHELKNPANYTHICAQSLDEELVLFKSWLMELAGDDDPEVNKAIQEKFTSIQELLETVENGTERLKEIAVNLGGFSRMGKGDLRDASISDCLRSTLALIKARYKNDVIFKTEFSNPVNTYCRPAALSQVFMNLLVNGCQSIQEKQSQKEFRDKGTIWIQATRQGEQAQVIIRDTGMGVPEDIKNNIFDAFFTTKPEGEGTGLGLSISKQIIEEHKGTIQLETTAGEGSKFTITFPIMTNPDLEGWEVREEGARD